MKVIKINGKSKKVYLMHCGYVFGIRTGCMTSYSFLNSGFRYSILCLLRKPQSENVRSDNLYKKKKQKNIIIITLHRLIFSPKRTNSHAFSPKRTNSHAICA